MNTSCNEKHSCVNNNNYIHKNLSDGKKSIYSSGILAILWMFFGILCLNTIVDNYLSYGLIKHPFDIFYSSLSFVAGGWPYFILLFLATGVQGTVSYGIEKLLAKELVPESVGNIIHFCNAFAGVILSTILITTSNFHPVAAHEYCGLLTIMCAKFNSYIIENKNLRRAKRNIHKSELRDESMDIDDVVNYPKNVTFSNAMSFYFKTASLIYKPKGVKLNEATINRMNLINLFLFSIAVHYFSAFITFQYMIPELENASIALENFQILQFIQTVLKLVTPVNIVWIIFYYIWIFKYLFAIYPWMFGSEDITVNYDWWNAKNMASFWSKWNLPIHSVLKKYVFVPLTKQGYTQLQASLITFIISGIIHEYFIGVPLKCCYGGSMLVMVLQIPLTIVTTEIHKRHGGFWGNLSVLVSLALGYTVSLIGIYANYKKNIYSI